MTEGAWVSIVALLGALILAVSALQGRRIGASKILVMALAWVAIFLFVVAVFSAAGSDVAPFGTSII